MKLMNTQNHLSPWSARWPKRVGLGLLLALASLSSAFAQTTSLPPPPNALPTASRLRVWLDGADPLGRSDAVPNGHVVRVWVDKSGSDNHVYSDSDGVSAVYDRFGFRTGRGRTAGLRFDGDDVYQGIRRLSFEEGLTVFFVAHNRSNRDYNGILSLRGAPRLPSSFEIYWQRAQNPETQGNLVAALNRDNPANLFFVHRNDVGGAPQGGAPEIFVVRFHPAREQLSIRDAQNNVLETTRARAELRDETLMVGLGFGVAPFGLEGTLGEVLVYDDRLDSYEMQDILLYLRSKWRRPLPVVVPGTR
jgi:hypothetical protein